MKIGTLTTQTMESGSMQDDKTYNLYIQVESIPFMFVRDEGGVILTDQLSSAGIHFRMDQSMQYDGVPVLITGLMSGAAIVVVQEKMEWHSSPDVGDKMWINLDDPYLKYTGE
jgi:hypothetical protein